MPYPLRLRLAYAGMVFVRAGPGIIHAEIPGVDLVIKYDLHHRIRPELGNALGAFAGELIPMYPGRWYILQIQRGGDFAVGRPSQPHLKYPAHNTGGGILNHQLMSVLTAPLIAIGGISPDILPRLLFAVQDRPDFTAQVPQMVVVHQGAEVKHIGVVALAVQAVQNGHKPASQRWENVVTNMDKTTKTMERSC